MKNTHFWILLALVGLAAIACNFSAGGGKDLSQTETTPTNSLPVASPTVVMPTEVSGTPFLSAPGVGNIKLLTDTERVGAKPLFEWETIPGADRYQLIVFDEAGEPYWAWEGIQTQIYMGGASTPPPDNSSGPSINSEYTWAVIAYASDGKIVAASDIRSISP